MKYIYLKNDDVVTKKELKQSNIKIANPFQHWIKVSELIRPVEKLNSCE